MAIAVVMAFHLNVPGFFNAGFLGVDIFFSLSGFLITSLLLGEYGNTGRIDWRRFYRRRLARLVPAVTLLLVASVVLVPLLRPQSIHRLQQDWFWASVYASNWWQILSEQAYFANFGNPPVLRHLWSLAVEMQFYLVWPWLLLAALRLAGVRAVLGLSALLALTSTALMAYWFFDAPTSPNRAYLGTDSHSMGLFVGASMACCWSPLHRVGLWPGFERIKAAWIALAGTLALGLLVYLLWYWNDAQSWLYQGGFLLASCLSVVLLVAAARLLQPGMGYPSGWPIVRCVGSRSYALYLWHWPVFVYFKGDEPPASAGVIVLCLTWTGLAAEFSYRCVEKPMNAWPMARLPRVVLAWIAAAGLLTALVTSHGGTSSTPTTDEPGPLPVDTPTTASVMAPAPAIVASATVVEPPPTLARDTRILAIGDSVMLGAREHLVRSLPGVSVDAQVGRQASQGLGLVRRYLEQANQVDRAVIHLGTNGYLQEADLRRLLNQLRGIDRVALVNVWANRRWTEPNNLIIARVASEFDNVRVVDWSDFADRHPHYFVRDGIHLTDDGIKAFVSEIAAGLGLESALPTPKPSPSRKGPKASEEGLTVLLPASVPSELDQAKSALPAAPPGAGDAAAADPTPQATEQEP